jgi:hypothetical protein
MPVLPSLLPSDSWLGKLGGRQDLPPAFCCSRIPIISNHKRSAKAGWALWFLPCDIYLCSLPVLWAEKPKRRSSGRCKLLYFLIGVKWHGRGRRFDPDQVHHPSPQYSRGFPAHRHSPKSAQFGRLSQSCHKPHVHRFRCKACFRLGIRIASCGAAQSEESSTTYGKAQTRPPSDIQGAPASHFW